MVNHSQKGIGRFSRRCAMNKKIWDLYAPIYEKAMRADRKCYKFMYHRIKSQIVGKEVLEIATYHITKE